MSIDPFSSINFEEALINQDNLNRKSLQKISYEIFLKLLRDDKLSNDEMEYYLKVKSFQERTGDTRKIYEIFKVLYLGDLVYLDRFAKQSSRQNLPEQRILNAGKILIDRGIIADFNKPEKVLNKNGLKLYILNGEEVWLSKKPSNKSRSVDFAVKLLNDKFVFISHKYGTCRGGTQNNQHDYLEHYMEECKNGKSYYIAMGDGAYYTEKIIKDLHNNYGDHNIMATNKDNLYKILKTINEI